MSSPVSSVNIYFIKPPVLDESVIDMRNKKLVTRKERSVVDFSARIVARTGGCGKTVLTKEKHWTQLDKALLEECLNGFGKNWDHIEKVLGRSQGSIRSYVRRMENLEMAKSQGNLVKTWSLEDNRQLLDLHAIHGNSWTSIAKSLPGRTDGQVRQQYRWLQKVSQKRDSFSSETDSPTSNSSQSSTNDNAAVDGLWTLAVMAQSLPREPVRKEDKVSVKHWTPAEITKLQELLAQGNHTWEALAVGMGRTVGAIKSFVSRLGENYGIDRKQIATTAALNRRILGLKNPIV